MTITALRSLVDEAPIYRPTMLPVVEAQILSNDDECAPAQAFDLELARVGNLLDSLPPKREWIVHNIIACGVVGILAAGGGVGKSILKLMLAVSTCTGLPWLGIPVVRNGSVLMFSAEDDRDEIHRRLHSVMTYYRQQFPTRVDDIDRLVRQHLHVFDRVGADNRLTEKHDGNISRTRLVDSIVATAQQLPDLRLVVLDPLSRFDGGDPNDNSDGTRLIECAEHIRKATGAAVLLSHHVAKTSLQNPESGQEAVRGASGLVDGARWVGLLQTLRQTEAKKYGIPAGEANLYVHFTAPKANYAPPWEGLWLKREAGGVLAPAEVHEVQGEGRRRDPDRYCDVLPQIIEKVRAAELGGDPLSLREFRSKYAGTDNVLKTSDGKLREYLSRAIEEGEIRTVQRDGRRGDYLEVTRDE